MLLDGAMITVLAVDEGKTTRLQIDFDLPLSEYKLLVWKPGGFERIEPPLMDQVLELPLQPTPMEVGRR